MQIKNAAVFTLEQGFIEKDVYIRNGYFVEKETYLKETDSQDEENLIDGKGCYLIPGLVDVHFHGCMGEDFSDGTEKGLEEIGRYELKNGITSICPASMTLSEEILCKATVSAVSYAQKYNMLCNAEKAKLGARLCGIHLEGPFLSMEKKGAQNPKYIQKPDVAMFYRIQEAAQGMVKLITIAPEAEGAEEFVKNLSNQVHISVGHTASDYKTAYRAFELGADHVTHFFNGMTSFAHREPGVFGAAYDAKHVMIELICDGVHVDASAVRVLFGLFGKERIILISDSIRAAGMPDGEYTLGGLQFTLNGKAAVLGDGTLAGSAVNLMECVRTAVKMGIPLESAVCCASYNAAKSIGVENVCGSIETGKYGDCVLLRKEDLSIQSVVLGGILVGDFK